MKAIITALLLLPLSSCIIANKDTVASLGGKFAYKGRDFGVIGDHERSFQDAALAVTAVAGAAISAGVSKAQEVTSQKATSGSNALKTVESNNATKVTLGEQATGLETTKSTVLNPNVIPK